jgi:hypothetical protein
VKEDYEDCMNTDSNELVRYAQNELKHLKWAIKEWNNLIKDNAIYLILDAFIRYYISSRVAGELQKNITNENITQLVNDFNKVRNEFIEICNVENIQKIIAKLDEKFFDYLNGKLYEVVRSYEDNVLFKDDEAYPGDFSYDTANDFIEFFDGVFYLIEFIKELHPSLQINQLEERFNSLEKNFKKEFYHFVPLKEQLAYQSQKFLSSAKEWWYKDNPLDYKPKYIEIYRIPIDVGEKTLECPDTQTIVDYAFDLLSYNEKVKWEKHVFSCNYCFDEVFQLRTAEQVIPDSPIFKPIPVSLKLKVKLNKLKKKIAVVSSSIIDGLTALPKWLPPQIMAPQRAMGIARDIDVEEEREILEPLNSFYILDVLPENNIITLLETPQNAKQDLTPLCTILNQMPVFYYKIFGFYSGKEIMKEILSGRNMGLPFKIDKPNTDLLLVFLSKDEEALNQNTNLAIEIITKHKEQKITDIFCLFVEIKNLKR